MEKVQNYRQAWNNRVMFSGVARKKMASLKIWSIILMVIEFSAGE